MLRDLNEIMKRFGNIRKRHEAFLRSVRNHTSAHKDHDAKRQLEWIESLDLTHMCELCNEIVNWLTSMHWFLIQFTEDVDVQLKAAD